MEYKKVLELGHFVGDVSGGDEENFLALQEALEDGAILPCAWETTDEDGEPAGLLDRALGCCEFASFVEIPRMGIARWETTGYGLGFSPDFLMNQCVEPVTYVHVKGEMPQIHPDAAVRDGLEYLLENWDSMQYYRGLATTALTNIRNDPEKRESVRQMIVDYANDKRIFYELVLDGEGLATTPEGDSPSEWRGTAPIQFTLADVQTIYVATLENVATLRLTYPGYKGTFVVLDRFRGEGVSA